MWTMFAVASAFFAGITAILSKVGTEDIGSNLATAVRTVVVFFFSWLMVLIVGGAEQINKIASKTMTFLVLSGLATGASWLCYFRALKCGNVNKVAPIDKSSTVITMILAFIFLNEKISPLKVVCIFLIGAGTYMMIEKRTEDKACCSSSDWLLWAVLSAVFAALTSILGKIGISDIDSYLGTAIRTSVVLVMAWLVVFIFGGIGECKKINSKNLFYLIVSGVTTGLSWLCYYKALKEGPASVVVPIDKLSILVTIFFSYVFLKEKLTKKSLCGLVLLVAGTLMLLI